MSLCSEVYPGPASVLREPQTIETGLNTVNNGPLISHLALVNGQQIPSAPENLVRSISRKSNAGLLHIYRSD